MTGSNGILITNRDLHLFEELATAKLLDRAMVQRISGFSSTNRANDRLLKLHRAGLLRRYFLGTEAGGRKSLYALSPKSAALIGLEKFWKFQRPENQVLVGEVFVEHQCAVNWVWIAAKYAQAPETKLLAWRSFQQSVSPKVPLIPDGYAEFQKDGEVLPVFFEIDLGTETSKVWERKVKMYLDLAHSGEFSRIFHRPRFRIAVVTASSRREANLRRLILKSTPRVFFFATLPSITEHGLHAAHWLRPAGSERVTLL